jgi:hypothetical protein
MYHYPVNSPAISNEQKEIYKKKTSDKYKKENITTATNQSQNQTGFTSLAQGEIQPNTEPLVNLQVFKANEPPAKKKSNLEMFMPFVTPSLYDPPQFFPYQYNVRDALPVIKNFNISISGPTADHARVAMIYQDALPLNSVQELTTFNTLGERRTIMEFVRSVLVKNHDGENMGVDAKDKNTLLSYIKFMELNPYNTYKFSANPYLGLASNFLMYRTCYPIRYDKISGAVSCAKNSIGMNVRIYMLSEGEYYLDKYKRNEYEYNSWRELRYYEYIREQIIKPNICPNFVCIYAYFKCEQSYIDLRKVNKFRTSGKQIDNQVQNTYIKELDVVHDGKRSNIYVEAEEAMIGKAIILLTESPTYNFLNWASKIYQSEGNVRTMLQTGYHNEKIWYSVLFQIMAALYTMQIKKIYITNFNLEHNIYIKDISVNNTVTNFWKYRVDGIDYYIPNFGYIALIDSDYSDDNYNNINKHKIYCDFMNYQINVDTKDSFNLQNTTNNITFDNKKTFEAFKKVFTANIFSSDFSNNGGTAPPQEIINFLSEIEREASTNINTDIGYYISKYFRKFMNNRIGTFLTKDETQYIIKEDSNTYTKGQILVYNVFRL